MLRQIVKIDPDITVCLKCDEIEKHFHRVCDKQSNTYEKIIEVTTYSIPIGRSRLIDWN